MGRASLEGVELKLERAKDHFHTLSESITTFLRDPKTYSTVFQTNKERRPVLVMEDIKDPSPEWDVFIGDCVHNLHSALDHLAFQLMVGNTPPLRQREFITSSAFPIFLSGPRFAKLRSKGPKRGQPTPDSGLHKILGVSATARTIIERLQPYHRRKNPGTRSLWELQELSNANKHRLFPLVYSSFELGQFEILGSVPFALHNFESTPGRLKRNAVIARWAYVTVPTPISMKVNAELVTDITFNKGPRTPYPVRGRSVLATLHGIMRFIAAEVVPPLADDLGVPFN
ncbi:MAG: hypothetical protein JW895_04855, partial [Thermoleophilaceae bacterium]|nr:hypothetical protein [Thermoleophilaceae bacterium]